MQTTTTLSRARRAAFAAAAMLTLGAAAASAQSARVYETRGFELRPYAGAYIPTGDQRDLLKDAVLVGAQASYRLIPQLALTGTFGWAPSKDRITAGNQTLDLFQYDLGLEGRAPAWWASSSGGVTFTPFAGLGVGGRTYDYRDFDASSKTNVAGFGALGGELGFGRAGARLEARDYVSRFEALTGDSDAKTRNDVTLALGLTWKF
jgi:hypothetical protein